MLRPSTCWIGVPSENVPSCVLLDVQLPGLDGPALQARLSELGSSLPIIFLTGHPDIPTTVKTIKAGADDFLTKPVSSNELLRAVERAIAHHDASRALNSKLDTIRAHISALTPRERQVFELVIRGDTNKQVAGALGCTVRTIKAHRQRVMGKMQDGPCRNLCPLPSGSAFCVGHPTVLVSQHLSRLIVQWGNRKFVVCGITN